MTFQADTHNLPSAVNKAKAYKKITQADTTDIFLPYMAKEPSGVLAFTFGAAASLSNKLFVPANSTISGLDTDTAWTAADLYLTICDTLGGTYWDVYNISGSAYTVLTAIMAAGKRRFIIPINDLASLSGYFLQLRSGPSGAAVAQVAARALTFTTKPL
jgi:hypothetical protein